MNNNTDIEKITKEFIQSVEDGELEKMKNMMAEDVHSYITNANGGVNLLQGRDAFTNNIAALDIKQVRPTIRITQILKVNQHQVMVMIEVKAKRKGKSLHNFASYLVTFKENLITEIYMVEALPAYSDEFWNS